MRKKEVQRKFLSPRSDVAFKELMRNEIVCRHFVSDVLGIPLEEIREVRPENTFLGRRSLFYLSKMYSEGAHAGEEYSQLTKCIVICVLGFKWDARPGYHKVYCLRDEEGQLYSDQLEIHVIELAKELTGDRLDDWIRLFQAENMEELEMMQKSTNPGVVEAVREVMTMNLGRRLRALYEEHMRIKRDRLYLRNMAIEEGLAIGKAAGMAEGRAEGRAEGMVEGQAAGEAIGELRRSRQAILELLEDFGEIPEDILSRINTVEDAEILRRWLKAAAKADGFADFREKMN